MQSSRGRYVWIDWGLLSENTSPLLWKPTMGSIWLRQEYKVIGWNGGPFHHCLKNSLRWNVFSFLVSVGPKFWVHGHSSESFLADCLEFRSTMADYGRFHWSLSTCIMYIHTQPFCYRWPQWSARMKPAFSADHGFPDIYLGLRTIKAMIILTFKTYTKVQGMLFKNF